MKNASIDIINTGFYTTIQDLGRPGYAHLGVPESGAMDKKAFYFANALLNNESNAAMLECTLIGPTIVFNTEVYFVITGGDVTAFLDKEYVEVGVPMLARAKQVLKLSKITNGSRSYLAFAGGLVSDVILGSKSWYYPVTSQGYISKGMNLCIGTSRYGSFKGVRLKQKSQLKSKTNPMPELNVYKGPEFYQLTPAQQLVLEGRLFTVSNLWNRMAIQLTETIENFLNSMYTSPVIPGTVQLTPSGKLIILMNDCQTTGGYPRILQVKSQDLDLLAQMQQGSQFLLTIR